MNNIPEIDSKWVHKGSNKEYSVIIIANLKSTRKSYPVTVVYEDTGNGNIWTKSLTSWHYAMKKILNKE